MTLPSAPPLPPAAVTAFSPQTPNRGGLIGAALVVAACGILAAVSLSFTWAGSWSGWNTLTSFHYDLSSWFWLEGTLAPLVTLLLGAALILFGLLAAPLAGRQPGTGAGWFGWLITLSVASVAGSTLNTIQAYAGSLSYFEPGPAHGVWLGASLAALIASLVGVAAARRRWYVAQGHGTPLAGWPGRTWQIGPMGSNLFDSPAGFRPILFLPPGTPVVEIGRAGNAVQVQAPGAPAGWVPFTALR